MQAVSFMYVRPPGYNAESAKAAEMNEEKKKEDMSKGPSADDGPSFSMYLLHHLLCISIITIMKLICY